MSELDQGPVAIQTDHAVYRGTKYCVMKQEDSEVSGVSLSVWIVVAGKVEAQNAQAAIKQIAIRDNEVLEGTYVAIPLTSFKPKTVKQVVQMSLGE